MIFYLAGIFFLAVVSAIPSGRVDVVFPSVETSRSGVKTVKFRALDEDVELKLEPAGDILAKNFALFDENNQIRHSVNVEELKRRIYRDSANGAALLIDEEGPVTIQGIVNSKLRIAPHESGRMIKDGKIAHQIVEVISDKKSFVKDRILPMGFNEEMQRVARMSRDDKCIVVECLVLTESSFTQRFKSKKALTEYITTMYTGVQNLLDTFKMGIKVRLLGITSFTKKSEPPYIKQGAIPGHEESLDPDKVLDNMGNYYCTKATGLVKSADLVMLIIGRKLGKLQDDGTVKFDIAGLAFQGTVCDKCFKFGLAEDDSEYNERVDTVAHESAHVLGSPHDGEGPEDGGPAGNPGARDCPETDGYIMGDRSDDVKKFKFSECSKKNVKYALSLPGSSCVYEDCEFY